MITREEAIDRALTLMEACSDIRDDLGQAIDRNAQEINRLQRERLELVEEAEKELNLHVGRYREIMELFGLTSADLGLALEPVKRTTEGEQYDATGNTADGAATDCKGCSENECKNVGGSGGGCGTCSRGCRCGGCGEGAEAVSSEESSETPARSTVLQATAAEVAPGA